MWKLISILFTILLITPLQKNEFVYIIIDDCKNWKEMPRGKLQDQFSFYKESESNRFIMIIHGWIEPSAMLSSQNLNLSQILEKKPIYTSDLNNEAWFDLLQDSNRKFFILRPDDFCSGKRFVLNENFTMYEAIISITRDE